jgi:GNAT superfamily N-acetyltransferase
MSDVVIRRAVSSDGSQIGLVHVRSWQATYRGLLPQSVLDGLDAGKRGEYWEQYLSADARPGETVLVAEEDGVVVGFASVGPSRDEDANGKGEVRAIYLLADHWGRGIGRALMDAALNTLRQAGCTQATLWLLDTNARARQFYEAGGWAPDGATKQDDGRGFPITEVRYRRELEPIGGTERRV